MHFTTETEKDQQLSKIIVRQLRNKIETKDSEFTLTYGIIFRGYRIFIPRSLRTKIFEELHERI